MFFHDGVTYKNYRDIFKSYAKDRPYKEIVQSFVTKHNRKITFTLKNGILNINSEKVSEHKSDGNFVW